MFNFGIGDNISNGRYNHVGFILDRYIMVAFEIFEPHYYKGSTFECELTQTLVLKDNNNDEESWAVMGDRHGIVQTKINNFKLQTFIESLSRTIKVFYIFPDVADNEEDEMFLNDFINISSNIDLEDIVDIFMSSTLVTTRDIYLLELEVEDSKSDGELDKCILKNYTPLSLHGYFHIYTHIEDPFNKRDEFKYYLNYSQHDDDKVSNIPELSHEDAQVYRKYLKRNMQLYDAVGFEHIESSDGYYLNFNLDSNGNNIVPLELDDVVTDNDQFDDDWLDEDFYLDQ